MRAPQEDLAALSPLSRRRLLRERRQRRRKHLAGGAVVALALSAAGVALTRSDHSDPGTAARRTVRSAGAQDGSAQGSHPPASAADAAATPETSTTTTSRPRSSKPDPSTTTPTSKRPSPSSTEPSGTTIAPVTAPPATPDPANAEGGVDPQSPPATGPAGPQGPVRATPCAPTGPPKVQPVMADGPSNAGRWVTVGRISGNCGATSGPLTTSGVDSRLMYRSDAAQFQVFLVDQADPSSSSGYADVECRGACADMQDLTDPAGRYQVRVLASDAPWEVLLQEFR